MITDIFLKGRTNWLNEIQSFRKDLQNMKLQLNVFSKEHPADEDQLNIFSESIDVINRRLDSTEKNILYSLNNGKIYWLDSFGNKSVQAGEANAESDLFDNMKNAYVSLIDLLRDVHNFLQKNLVSE